MRHTVSIVLLFIVLATASTAQAADPQQLFGAILGQIEGHIQRKQQRRQRKHLARYWQACARGDVEACDAAKTFPLNSRGRAQVERMRAIAIGRPEYERNWYACQKMDQAGCSAALRFPGASTHDRRKIQRWLRQAKQQHRREQRMREARQKLIDDCLAFEVIDACSRLLAASNLGQQDRTRIYEWREQLLAKQQRERAAEASRIAYQALTRKCFDGQLQACRDAISHSNVTSSNKRRLIAKRDQILAANAARERRLAEQRNFSQLKTDCLSNEVKTACVAASRHRLASQSERRRFDRKQNELSSLPAQLMSSFAKATSGGNWDSPVSPMLILMAALSIAGGAAALGYTMRFFRREPTKPPPIPPMELAQEPVFAAPFTSPFPLTGHLPTDVRQVLHGS